ncbi:MAG: Phthiocerol synthesis polyketide synthase type PpsC [Pseudomonadota bacterium]|jgi:putative PIG3 family NAD(P)H quinone oxidoreductase
MSIPATMKLIEHGAGGPPSVLTLGSGPVPTPGPGELLVRVAYAGVNRPDVLQRSGNYPPPPGASPLLGLEVSGHVAAIGDGVTGWALGDAVCALCNGGGYAEYVTVPAGQSLPVPRGLSMLQAAALPETYFTVWTNVFERGRLAAGETILVHGGSSGIGLTAIQMAKAWGATVYTTVGNAEKAEACVAHGADVAINYRQQNFVDEVQSLTGKRGVNLILDMVGGEYIALNLRCLALEGRLVQIAFLQGSKVDIDLMPVMMKRLTFTGSTLRARPAAEKAQIAAALREKIWPHLEAGRMLPHIHREFALGDAAQAHALMESSEHIGKIMLRVAG